LRISTLDAGFGVSVELFPILEFVTSTSYTNETGGRTAICRSHVFRYIKRMLSASRPLTPICKYIDLTSLHLLGYLFRQQVLKYKMNSL